MVPKYQNFGTIFTISNKKRKVIRYDENLAIEAIK
jgi:hypothetical protein